MPEKAPYSQNLKLTCVPIVRNSADSYACWHFEFFANNSLQEMVKPTRAIRWGKLALQKFQTCLGSLTVEPEWNKWCARNIWNFCNRWKHLITSTNRPLYACFNHGRFIIFWIAPIDIFDVGNTGHCIHKGSAFVVAFVWTDVFVRSPTK